MGLYTEKEYWNNRMLDLFDKLIVEIAKVKVNSSTEKILRLAQQLIDASEELKTRVDDHKTALDVTYSGVRDAAKKEKKEIQQVDLLYQGQKFRADVLVRQFTIFFDVVTSLSGNFSSYNQLAKLKKVFSDTVTICRPGKVKNLWTWLTYPFDTRTMETLLNQEATLYRRVTAPRLLEVMAK